MKLSNRSWKPSRAGSRQIWRVHPPDSLSGAIVGERHHVGNVLCAELCHQYPVEADGHAAALGQAVLQRGQQVWIGVPALPSLLRTQLLIHGKTFFLLADIA